MNVSRGGRITKTLQRPVRQRRFAPRLVVPALVVVTLVTAVWALGIVGWPGWPGGTFDGAWQLRSAEVDGRSLSLTVSSRPLGLTLQTNADQDAAGVQAPCNDYTATVSGANDVIPDRSTDLGFAVVSSTLAACAQPATTQPATTQLEDAYIDAVRRVDHAERDVDVLTLTGPGVTLVFDRAAPGVLQE
jgi:META domain